MRTLLVLVTLSMALKLCAQELPTTKTAPQPQTSSQTEVYRDAIYTAAVFCGTGTDHAANTTTVPLECGVGGSIIPVFTWTEAGIMGPLLGRNSFSGYLTNDFTTFLPITKAQRKLNKAKWVPYGFVGYTRFFETGNAIDFGGGVDIALKHNHESYTRHSIRVEVRDYWNYSGTSQHTTLLRIGWMGWLQD